MLWKKKIKRAVNEGGANTCLKETGGELVSVLFVTSQRAPISRILMIKHIKIKSIELFQKTGASKKKKVNNSYSSFLESLVTEWRQKVGIV